MLKVEYLDVADLKPYEKNAKIHTQEQIEQIKQSIKEFGMNDPIGVWGSENLIVEGHGRLLACQQLGMKEVPIIRLDDLTDDQRRAYTLIHNQTTMNTGFDIDILNEELDNIDIDMSGYGFDIEIDDVEEGAEVKEDEAPEVKDEEPKAKIGNIYQLGRHRLMCGDSTSSDDVFKLVGGVDASPAVDLLITDPPYNVDYTGKTKDALKIINDSKDADTFHDFLYNAFINAYAVMKDGAPFYVWYASKEVVNFSTALADAGLSVKQELIWNKNSLVMGRQDYQWKHEPCLYGWKETDSHNWYGDRKQTTVIDFDRPTKSELHPTMKPVGLFDYQIKNSTKKGDNVLDLFGGSGTTIMACEQNGRNAYVMEYDPHYIDVIIERWENFTGQKVKL